MNGLLDTAQMYFMMGLTYATSAFVVLSVVLFIVDGVKAKRQHRKRKAGITVMFIISMVLIALMIIAVGVFFYLLIYYIGSTF